MSKKTKSKYPPTPELDKLQSVKDRSQACGEFLEWLRSDGIELCRRHEHTEDCHQKVTEVAPHGERTRQAITCGMRDGQLWPESISIEKTLAKFFGIDLNKVDDERRAILKHLQNDE